jgi:hypothetical protein
MLTEALARLAQFLPLVAVGGLQKETQDSLEVLVEVLAETLTQFLAAGLARLIRDLLEAVTLVRQHFQVVEVVVLAALVQHPQEALALRQA